MTSFLWENDEGWFQPSSEQRALEKRLDAILDVKAAGSLSLPDVTKCLFELANAAPEYIDGHSHLGHSLLQEDKPKEALAAFARGVALGQTVIPSTFKGRIDWSLSENRPYLRALHGTALCHMKLGQEQTAAKLMEKLLGFNPDDNFGVRYLIGPIYLRLGKLKKARTYLERDKSNHYPTTYYELGLLHIREENWSKAATMLRKAFGANPYIAEALCGNLAPISLAIWHGSNYREPEFATEYISNYGAFWKKTHDAIPFLHWLYHQPTIMRERAEFLEADEGLLWQHDSSTRIKLTEQKQKLSIKIDATLSEQLIVKRKNRNGEFVFPWQIRHSTLPH